MNDPDPIVRRLDELMRLERAARDITDALRTLILLHHTAHPPSLATGVVRLLEGTIFTRSQEIALGLSHRFADRSDRTGEVLQ